MSCSGLDTTVLSVEDLAGDVSFSRDAVSAVKMTCSRTWRIAIDDGLLLLGEAVMIFFSKFLECTMVEGKSMQRGTDLILSKP